MPELKPESELEPELELDPKPGSTGCTIVPWEVLCWDESWLGTDGTDGTSGTDGISGCAGASGCAGTDSTSGADGVSGTEGVTAEPLSDEEGARTFGCGE